MTTVLLKRFTNTNINDTLPTSFINTQGQPLLRLARMDQYYSTTSNPNSGDLYQSMKNCYQNDPTQFAFNQYGSLGNAYDGTVFYTSPLDSTYTFNKNTDLLQSASTTNNINGVVFGQMAKYPTQNALGGKGAVTYVSPANAKFILNIKPDPSDPSELVFSIYFNPLQDPNLSSDNISSNLSSLCNLISNADPMCFCAGDICTQSALGGADNANTLKTKSPGDYETVQSNCTCLSSACQYAAENEPNNFTSSFSNSCKNGTQVCGANFEFVKNQGVYSPDNQKWLPDQCGLNSFSTQYANVVPPPPPPSIQPNTPPAGSNTSNTPPAGSKPMSTGMKIAISIAIILIIISIMYFMMQ